MKEYMTLNKSNKTKNRIANLLLLMLLAGAILYCLLYVKGGLKINTEEEKYPVVIRTQEPEVTAASEELTEDTDMYEEDYLPISVLVSCSGITREIRLYVSEGKCYAFLPAYADVTRLSYDFDDAKYEVSLKGKKLSKGECLQGIETNTEYEFEMKDGEDAVFAYTMVFMQSQNLPSVFIDTVSGSMDYVDCVKGNEEPGEFLCITADGKTDSQCAMNRIKGRGNTSWSGIGKKNQYNIQLEKETDVLDMGSAQNWIIQANKFDVSMMRNKLAYDFAKDIGVPYAVDSRFTDMYINGKYMGTYQVIEKIETGTNRIDIDEETGYVIERDFREKDPNKSFETSYGTYAIRSPKDITAQEHDYIAAYVNKAAEAISKAAYSDEYLDYIDINSFAKLFIMNEISNDPDANALSTYFYKADQTDETKLVAGPVWDFDIAFCNDERGTDILCSKYGEEWFADLYQSEAFQNEVSYVLQDIMEEYYEKYENSYFAQMQMYLEPSYRMNEIRWKEKRGFISSLYPEYEETIGFLKYYFTTRLSNLNEVFNGPDQYYKVEFVTGGLQFAHVYVAEGNVIPAQTLQGIEEYYGRGNWRLKNDQEIDADTYQVFNDVIIKCRSIRGDDEAEQLEAELVPEMTKEDEKGELAMQWISFIMLMVPGLIAVWISGNTRLKKENALTVLMQYLCNTFIILLLAYGIFYVLYDSAVLSFSDIYDESYQFSIYNINVAFKYLLLAGVLSVAVGMAERILCAMLNKRKKEDGQCGQD